MLLQKNIRKLKIWVNWWGRDWEIGEERKNQLVQDLFTERRCVLLRPDFVHVGYITAQSEITGNTLFSFLRKHFCRCEGGLLWTVFTMQKIFPTQFPKVPCLRICCMKTVNTETMLQDIFFTWQRQASSDRDWKGKKNGVHILCKTESKCDAFHRVFCQLKKGSYRGYHRKSQLSRQLMLHVHSKWREFCHCTHNSTVHR